MAYLHLTHPGEVLEGVDLRADHNVKIRDVVEYHLQRAGDTERIVGADLATAGFEVIFLKVPLRDGLPAASFRQMQQHHPVKAGRDLMNAPCSIKINLWVIVDFHRCSVTRTAGDRSLLVRSPYKNCIRIIL